MIRQLSVIGSGTMGRGIAYLAAVAGYEAVLHDAEASALEAAKASIDSMLRKGVEKNKLTQSDADEALGRLHSCPISSPRSAARI